MVKKIIGAALIAAPFVVITVSHAIQYGITETLVAWAAAVVAVAVLFAGIYFVTAD